MVADPDEALQMAGQGLHAAVPHLPVDPVAPVPVRHLQPVIWRPCLRPPRSIRNALRWRVVPVGHTTTAPREIAAAVFAADAGPAPFAKTGTAAATSAAATATPTILVRVVTWSG